MRRIEFQGNTTTRDKVIRRELALEEGQVYNGNLWELSLLRLNQLQYFEPLKPEQDSDNQAEPAGCDGRHSAEGQGKGQEQHRPDGRRQRSFGWIYRRQLHHQQPVRQGRIAHGPGHRSASTRRTRHLSFTQPYLFDRPLQFSWTVYHSSYNYNQQQQLEVQPGQSINLPASYQALLQNYTQTSTGVSTSLSYPIKRSFKRVGITYSFDDTTLQTYSAASTLYFREPGIPRIVGPNALTGIQTSKVVPNFSYNRIDNPQRPHQRTELLCGDGNCRPRRQHALPQAGGRMEEVPANAERPQHAGLPRARFVDQRLCGRRGPALRPLLHGRRSGLAWLRYPFRLSRRTLPHGGHDSAAEPGWHHGPAGSDESAARNVERYRFPSTRSSSRAATPVGSPTWSTACPSLVR